MPGGKSVCFAGIKQTGGGTIAREFVEFQFLEAFLLLQAHLENGDQRHQGSGAEKHSRDLSGERMRKPAEGKAQDHRRQQRQKVHHANFSSISFHQLNSRSSNSIKASERAAPRYAAT